MISWNATNLCSPGSLSFYSLARSTVSHQQHDDRLDPNKFVKVVFKIMSEHMKDPIKKVQLDFNPILHHLVGKYTMKSTVTHQTKDGACWSELFA